MDPITTGLIAWGPPGLIIAVLLLALKDIFGKLQDSQQKRIEESGKAILVMEQFSNALKEAFKRLDEDDPEQPRTRTRSRGSS